MMVTGGSTSQVQGPSQPSAGMHQQPKGQGSPFLRVSSSATCMIGALNMMGACCGCPFIIKVTNMRLRCSRVPCCNLFMKLITEATRGCGE
jgi:hypothetical protein